MMETARTCETSVNFYPDYTALHPEDSHLRTYRRENLKSYLFTRDYWDTRLGSLQYFLLRRGWGREKEGQNTSLATRTNSTKQSSTSYTVRRSTIKKFPAFYGTTRFITVFIKTHHRFLSWLTRILYTFLISSICATCPAHLTLIVKSTNYGAFHCASFSILLLLPP
jgi:hypothetical protein